MRHLRFSRVPLLGFLLLGCGSEPVPAPVAPAAPPPAASAPVAAAPAPVAAASPAAPSETSAPERAASATGTRDIPAGCPGGEKSCTPPPAFAEGTCRSKFPDLPLMMFAKGTPWPRMYVKAEYVEPVNVYDGERSDTWMHFGEELLILREHVSGDVKSVKVSGP